jgi:hypothetical protein
MKSFIMPFSLRALPKNPFRIRNKFFGGWADAEKIIGT